MGADPKTMTTATAEPRLRRPQRPATPRPKVSDRPAPPPEAPAVQSANFNDHFVKMTFETSVWTGRRRARGIEATFDGSKVDEDRVARPQVCLLPKHLDQEIQRARQACYSAFNKYSVPCDSAGTRLLGFRSIDDAVADIQAAIAAFHATADAVADRLPEILEYNRDYWLERCAVDERGRPLKREVVNAEAGHYRYNGVLDEEQTRKKYEEVIGALLPDSREEFRKAFRAEYRLTEPSSVAAQFQEKAVRDFFTAARKNAQAHADDVIRLVVEEPVQRLLKELRSLSGRLKDDSEGKRLDPRSFNGIGAAIKLLMSCGDAIHPGMLRQVQSLDAQLAATLETVKSANEAGISYTDAIRAEAPSLVDAIDRVAALAEQKRLREDMLHRYGVRPMTLELD